MSAEEYTPTTDEVRSEWVERRWALGGSVIAKREFDRWLAARDAETRQQALEEAADVAARMYAGTDGTDAEREWIGGCKATESAIRALAEGADQ